MHGRGPAGGPQAGLLAPRLGVSRCAARLVLVGGDAQGTHALWQAGGPRLGRNALFLTARNWVEPDAAQRKAVRHWR